MAAKLRDEFELLFVLNSTLGPTSTLGPNSTYGNNSNEPDIISGDHTEMLPLRQSTIRILYLVYFIVLLVGLAGNFLTCAVIILRKSMRKSIHFYTFSLAICDLLILFFYIPTQLAYIREQLTWTMGLTMCKVSYFVLPIAISSTSGTLLAITTDRVRGLIYPFKWRSDSLRTAKITIPIIWFVSLLLNCPLFVVPYLYKWKDSTTVSCSENWPTRSIGRMYWIGMFVVVFAIPLIIIFFAHIRMLFVMLKETNLVNRKYNKKMIEMTISVVVVFAVCTGFQHVFFFISTYSTIKLSLQKEALLFCTANFVVSLQAALNPIIYGTLRHDFKKAFESLLIKMMQKLKFRSPSSSQKKMTTSVNSLSFPSVKGDRDTSCSRYSDSPSTEEKPIYFQCGSYNITVKHSVNEALAEAEMLLRKSIDIKFPSVDETLVKGELLPRQDSYAKKVYVKFDLMSEHISEPVPLSNYEALQSLPETIL